MFEATVDVYDLVYAHKDYEAEADWVRRTIRARNPHARTLLDVACGTGRHLEHLSCDYDAQGVDLLEAFIAQARRRTGAPIHQGDMNSFDLGDRFDAVVCLFSSIGYARDLPGAITAMARHVAPGGILIVEPWFTPEQWEPGHVQVLDHEGGGVRVVRMTQSDVDGNVAVMTMHYLIAQRNEIEHRREEHRMTLFSSDEYEAAFRSSGLTFEVDQPGPFGRGAFLGLAPP